MAEVPVIIKLLAERTGSVESVLRGTQRQFDALAGSITQLGTRASLALGGLTAGMVALGATVVRTAGQFEILNAKLVSALGSGEKAAAAFSSTLRYAAQTPFDVKGLTQATVTLEAYRQRSQETLPLVANLAAAFGEEVQESALVLGKALSGSLDGFKSLRNQYGITTVELKRFGVETTELGGISVRTAAQLEKARNALKTIISTRFGDAVARQSATLFGSISNLGDVITRVASAFGTELIPALTAVTRTITGAIEAFERLPAGFRQTLVIGGVFATGMVATAAAVTALGTTLISSTTYLLSFAAAMGRAGVGAAAGAAGVGAGAKGAADAAAVAIVGFQRLRFGIDVALFSINSALATKIPTSFAAMATAMRAGAAAALPSLISITTAISEMATASLAFLATPLGAALIALGLVAGAVAASYSNLARQMELSKAVDAQARASSEASSQLRTYSAELEKATGVQAGFLGTGKSVAETAQLVSTALGKVGLADFANNLAKAGVTADDLKRKLAENRSEADKTRQDVVLLADALRRLEKNQGQGFGGGGDDKIDGLVSAEDLKRIQELTGGTDTSMAKLGETVNQLKFRMNQLGSTKVIFEALIGSVDQVTPALDAAAESAQVFGEYLRIAAKTDDLNTLRSILVDTGQKLQEVSGKLGQAGIQTADLGALQRRLLTAGIDEKKAIEEYLKLLEQQEQLQNKIRTKQQQGLADDLRQIQEEAELKKLAGQEYVKAELQQLDELLQQEGVSSQLRLQILREKTQLANEERQKEVGAARESFQKLTLDVRDSVEEVRTSGTATSREVATSIEGVIAKLTEWKNANQAVLNKSPEMRQAFASTFASFEKDLKRANAAIPKEDFDALVRSAKEFGVEATTTPQKLAAVKQALALIEKGNQEGLVKGLEQETRYREFHNQLTHQQLTLQQQLAKEKDAEIKKTRDLALSLAEQELGLLEKRAAAGDKYAGSQVKAAKEDIFAGRIQQIRDQEQQEIDSGNKSAESIEQAHERAQMRITQLYNEETAKRIDAQKKEGDEAETQTNRMLDLRNQLAGIQKQKGASPLISLQELGLQSELQFAGGPGSRNEGGLGGSIFASQNKTIAQVKAGVAADFGSAERSAARRASGADTALARTPVHNSTHSVTHNWNVHLPTASKGAKAAQELSESLETEADRKQLTFSPGGPRGVK